MKEFFKQLSKNKFEINRQRNINGLIPMKLFMSFLTVKVDETKDCLGSCNGWTQHYGDNDLIIKGGILKRVEYLDTISYQKKLDNVYNNYVNPFYIFDIMNKDGKDFFLKYYAEDIEHLINQAKEDVKIAGRKYRQACATRVDMVDFWHELHEVSKK